MARKMIDFSKLSPQELKEFKNKYDCYIFDMDGVLVHIEAGAIDGVDEALNVLAKNGKEIHVVTDNCLSTLRDIADRVHGFFPVIKKENVMGSGSMVVRYLKEINFNKKIYAVGEGKGIIAEMKYNGFDVIHDEEVKKITVMDLRTAKFEEGVGAVLVAGDMNFTYMKMFKAANYLADPKVLLIQAHIPDIAALEPVVVPGVGSVGAAIKAGSGRTEAITMGKGSEFCSKYLKSLGFPPERCLFVGDTIYTDMVAAHMMGMDSLLTLTGISSLEDVEIAKSKNLESHIPTYYTKSAADLIKAFKTE